MIRHAASPTPNEQCGRADLGKPAMIEGVDFAS